MARCKLDLKHPKFLRSIGGDNADPDLMAGLNELKNKVANNHTQGDWFSQPMPNFPDFQNKIWKWSFAPKGVRSSTRKKWRLLAYVPDHKAAEPIPAVAFHIYSKADTEVLGPKQIAGILKEFLTAVIDVKTVEIRFRRQVGSDGSIISLCRDCYEVVAMSGDEGEVDILEETHECPIATEESTK